MENKTNFIRVIGKLKDIQFWDEHNIWQATSKGEKLWCNSQTIQFDIAPCENILEKLTEYIVLNQFENLEIKNL